MARRPFAFSVIKPKSKKQMRLVDSLATNKSVPITKLHDVQSTDYSESVVLLQEFFGSESIHRAIGIQSSQSANDELQFQGIWFESAGDGSGHWYPQFRTSQRAPISQEDGVDLEWQQSGSHGFCQVFAILQFLANDYTAAPADKLVAQACVAKMQSSTHDVSGMPIWAENAQALIPLMEHLINTYHLTTEKWKERQVDARETVRRVWMAIKHLKSADTEFKLEQFSYDITT